MSLAITLLTFKYFFTKKKIESSSLLAITNLESLRNFLTLKKLIKLGK